MNAFNQAFIKAYAKRPGPQPKVAASSQEDVASTAEVAPSEAVQDGISLGVKEPVARENLGTHVISTVQDSTVELQPNTKFFTRQDSASSQIIPPPHVSFRKRGEPEIDNTMINNAMESDAAKMVRNSEVGPKMEALVQPDTEAGAGGTKRPLSSFAKTQVTGEAFRPMLEVNRFVWPKATDAMLDRIGQSVQKFAQGLIHGDTKGGQLVLFSTASSSAGGSTMMVCLARCLSRMGQKVAMVDADVSHPSLARDVGVAPQIGWENVLKGELPLVEVLIESVLDGITLLPLRECQPHDAELMANLHAGVSLEILRQHYDVILVDAGHGDGASRPANLLLRAAPFQTAVVVVDGRGSDSLPAAQRVVSTMRQSVKQVRLVENFATPNDLTRQGTKARNPEELTAA